MSSGDTETRELSPADDASSSKRRRIAFSCFECRRRKLKCDRLFPACGRCRKARKPEACTYDNEAVQSGLRHSSRERTQGERRHGLLPSRPQTRLPSVSGNLAADRNGETLVQSRPSEELISKLHMQGRRIQQLENRIMGLEKAFHGNSHGPQYNDLNLHFSKSSHETDLEERGVAKETLIFRGKDFKTQFHGSSNYSTYLSLVSQTDSSI